MAFSISVNFILFAIFKLMVRALPTSIEFVQGNGGVADVDVGPLHERAYRVAAARQRVKLHLRHRPIRRPAKSKTTVDRELRRKHWCYHTKRKLIECIYKACGRYGSSSAAARRDARTRKPNAMTQAEAAKVAKIGSFSSARAIL